MRVRIVQKHGYITRDGHEFPFGTEAELGDDLAVKLLNHHIAVPAPIQKRESAVVAPRQNTAKHTSKAAKKTAPAVKGGDDA